RGERVGAHRLLALLDAPDQARALVGGEVEAAARLEVLEQLFDAFRLVAHLPLRSARGSPARRESPPASARSPPSRTGWPRGAFRRTRTSPRPGRARCHPSS